MLKRFYYIALLLLQPVQVAFALSHFKLNITNPIEQCGPVEIKLRHGDFVDGRGDDPTAVSLTILPFNSSNLVIPVPGLSQDSDAIHLNFIPLAADIPFVASLSDASGELLGFASDIIRIQSSGSSDCLPAASDPKFYSIPDTISQCEDFAVTYDSSIITNPPRIKAVAAFGPSYDFKATSPPEGTQEQAGATFYSMNAFRGIQIALAIDDGNGHAETTSLFTVGGDSSSSKTCIDFGNFTLTATSTPTPSSSSSAGISTRGLIGIGIGVAVFILTIAAIMIVYIVRQRRSRRRAESRLYKELFWAQTGGPGRGSVASSFGTTAPAQPVTAQVASPGVVANPAYTSQYFEDDDDGHRYYRNTADYWVHVPSTGEDKAADSPTRPGVQRRPTAQSSRHFQSPSVTTLDIAQILDTAAEYQDPQTPRVQGSEKRNSARSSKQLVAKMDTPVAQMHLTSVDTTLDPIPALAVTPTSPESVATSMSSRRKPRGPADVPVDPTSFISNRSNGAMFSPFSGQTLDPNQGQGHGFRISHISAMSNAQSIDPVCLQKPPQAH